MRRDAKTLVLVGILIAAGVIAALVILGSGIQGRLGGPCPSRDGALPSICTNIY